MARIRTIKPEFPQSETVGKLSRDARLLFIQLWTIVDDDGRARAASRMLASLLYPYDDDAPRLMETWLEELEEAGCIRRYVVDGSSYLDLPTWLKHQKIDKPSKSKIPPFEDGVAKPREPSRSLAPDLGPRTVEGEEEPTSLRSVERASAPNDGKSPKEKKRATRIPDDWTPSDDEATALGIPAARIPGIKAKFTDYWRGQPGQRGVKLDWPATWRNWCRTEAERNGWAPIASVESFARPAPPGTVFFEEDTPGWHEKAFELRQEGKLMPAALYSVNGKRGCYAPALRSKLNGEAA